MTYDEMRQKLVISAANQKIGIAGEFELTPYCNLSCKMCYVKKQKKESLKSTSEILNIIAQAKEQGMLFCLLTGGEIFTRPDFKQIYESSFDMGLQMVLFTNGILINHEIIDILIKRPPEYVAITLYGASNQTYMKITKDPLGFDKVIKSLQLLKNNNINLQLRTIAIPEIIDDLPQIFTIFQQYQCPITYSLYVGPSRNDLSMRTQRLTPAEIVKYEQQHLQFLNEKIGNGYKYGNCGFSCAAGKSAFFVTWDGYLTPCAMMTYPKIRIGNDFKETWKEFTMLCEKVPSCKECKDCEVKDTCIQCPARRYLEGSLEKCSKYLKSIAIGRDKKIEKI